MAILDVVWQFQTPLEGHLLSKLTYGSVYDEGWVEEPVWVMPPDRSKFLLKNISFLYAGRASDEDVDASRRMFHITSREDDILEFPIAPTDDHPSDGDTPVALGFIYNFKKDIPVVVSEASFCVIYKRDIDPDKGGIYANGFPGLVLGLFYYEHGSDLWRLSINGAKWSSKLYSSKGIGSSLRLANMDIQDLNSWSVTKFIVKSFNQKVNEFSTMIYDSRSGSSLGVSFNLQDGVEIENPSPGLYYAVGYPVVLSLGSSFTPCLKVLSPIGRLSVLDAQMDAYVRSSFSNNQYDLMSFFPYRLFGVIKYNGFTSEFFYPVANYQIPFFSSRDFSFGLRGEIQLSSQSFGGESVSITDNGSGTVVILSGTRFFYEGNMYIMTSDVILNKSSYISNYSPSADVACWVRVRRIPESTNLDQTGLLFDLVIRPGVWDTNTQTYRKNDGITLEWMSEGSIRNPPTKEVQTGRRFASPSIKNSYNISITRGYYYAIVASGLGGMPGTSGGNGGAGKPGITSYSSYSSQTAAINSGNLNGGVGGAGQAATYSIESSVAFEYTYGSLSAFVGASGTNGGNGGDGGMSGIGTGVFLNNNEFKWTPSGGGGGGGACGTGEASYLLLNGVTLVSSGSPSGTAGSPGVGGVTTVSEPTAGSVQSPGVYRYGGDGGGGGSGASYEGQQAPSGLNGSPSTTAGIGGAGGLSVISPFGSTGTIATPANNTSNASAVVSSGGSGGGGGGAGGLNGSSRPYGSDGGFCIIFDLGDQG